MIKFKFDADLSLINDIEKLKKEVRKEIVDNGLDERLASDIMTLKKELLKTINEARQQNTNSETIDEPILSITQSESELIKHFTGLDPETIRKSKDFTKLVEHKVAFVRRDGNMLGNDPSPSKMTPGISYRMDMSQYDTFESQHNKAIDYFNNSLYVIEQGGRRRFFINPGGHDLTRFIKVVCTKDTGDTANARERFEKYRTGNNRFRNNDSAGYADWTLRKEAINYIQNNFVDLTDIIEKIQNGEEDEAAISAQRKTGRSTALSEFQAKVQNIKDRKDINPNTEVYLNLVRMIKNLKILKRMAVDGVQYSLVTNDPSSTSEKEQEFLDNARNTIYMWEVSHQEKWVSALIRKVNKLVQRYAPKG